MVHTGTSPRTSSIAAMMRILVFAAFVSARYAAAADIHEAVRSDDMAKIKSALKSGEDINKIGGVGPRVCALASKELCCLAPVLRRAPRVALLHQRAQHHVARESARAGLLQRTTHAVAFSPLPC